MYGYRQENGLMTNLNSISSSLSSLDTIGQRNSVKASVDNLIGTRSQSVASTNLLWRGGETQPKDGIDTYSTAASIRNGNANSRYQGSEVYYSHYSKNRSVISYCPDAGTALNFILAPLLLLTITRQTFDFLGQIWLQIIINFFTIIIIIVALFGIRQRRISYLSSFSLWSLFNTAWNLIVMCIHTKVRDVGIGEDALSFYTGSTSWWHTNGPGCLPYSISSSIQPQIGILQPNIIAGCRVDYHIIESIQSILHASLSLLASLFCCCFISNIRKDPNYKHKNGHNKAQPMSEKPYRMNNLRNDRSKINSDPYPNRTTVGPSLGGGHVSSLRRSATKTSTRSSVHSASSMRSARRRSARRSTEVINSQSPPRVSTSSAQRSHKYGSLSSRRSSSRREARRGGDINSLTYGTANGSTHQHRSRLSSLSSADYLPSYQPPHSSNANLLSSYGEISSIDSYNNNNVERHSGRQARLTQSSRNTNGF